MAGAWQRRNTLPLAAPTGPQTSLLQPALGLTLRETSLLSVEASSTLLSAIWSGGDPLPAGGRTAALRAPVPRPFPRPQHTPPRRQPAIAPAGRHAGSGGLIGQEQARAAARPSPAGAAGRQVSHGARDPPRRCRRRGSACQSRAPPRPRYLTGPRCSSRSPSLASGPRLPLGAQRCGRRGGAPTPRAGASDAGSGPVRTPRAPGAPSSRLDQAQNGASRNPSETGLTHALRTRRVKEQRRCALLAAQRDLARPRSSDVALMFGLGSAPATGGVARAAPAVQPHGACAGAWRDPSCPHEGYQQDLAFFL